MVHLGSETNPASGPSIAPALLHGRPADADWLQLAWSDTTSIDHAISQSEDVPGIYRLLNGRHVVYLGESKKLKSRL